MKQYYKKNYTWRRHQMVTLMDENEESAYTQNLEQFGRRVTTSERRDVGVSLNLNTLYYIAIDSSL